MRRKIIHKAVLLAGSAVLVENAFALTPEDPAYYGSVYPGDVVEPVNASAQAVAPSRAGILESKLEKALGPAGYLVGQTESNTEFTRAITLAVGRHPSYHAEAAGLAEGGAARKRARAALYPQISSHVGVDYSISRAFADNTDNVVESLRPAEQVTASISASQLIFDGGATIQRIRSARAQDAEIKGSLRAHINQCALDALTTYQDVAAHQALLAFSKGYIERQLKILEDVKERERLGAGSKADVTRALARLAAAKARYAEISESKRIADVRYSEYFDGEPPRLLRPAMAEPAVDTRADSVKSALENNPQVAIAEARADATRADFKAARSARLPSLKVTVDAYKYDVFDGNNDFDVRAGLAVHYDIFGGGARAADIATARSRAERQKFQEEQVRRDVAREAGMAFERIDGADEKLAALADALIAHDETRDLVLERYKLSRGDLIDVLQAENDYFEAGVAYVIALSARDMAGYALMEHTGDLIRLFSPENAYEEARYGAAAHD
ncbi:MAG: TolC family protein [Parvularculaceae bacterium]